MQDDQNKHFVVILNYFVFFLSLGHRDISFLQIMTSGVFEKCFQKLTFVRNFEKSCLFDVIRYYLHVVCMF